MLNAIQIEVAYLIARIGFESKNGRTAANNRLRSGEHAVRGRLSSHGVKNLSEIHIQLVTSCQMTDGERIGSLDLHPIQQQ